MRNPSVKKVVETSDDKRILTGIFRQDPSATIRADGKCEAVPTVLALNYWDIPFIAFGTIRLASKLASCVPHTAEFAFLVR